MILRPFEPQDAQALFAMMEEEGAEWADYYGPSGRPRYLEALRTSRTYVAWEGEDLCGYVRCREDDGFGVYVYDLLVRPRFRGRGIGGRLMERAGQDFPGQALYVMSDVDPYYEKLGYERIGSVFQAPPSQSR